MAVPVNIISEELVTRVSVMTVRCGKDCANGGTPGYDNGAVKGKIAELSAASITISEIMVDPGEGRQNLAQWIELYNSSMTQAVTLGGWKLAIENANSDVETALSATLSRWMA